MTMLTLGALALAQAQVQATTPAAQPRGVEIPQSTPAAPATEAPPSGAPRIEFRGADGKPLPPEVQQQLRERFKNGLPPGALQPPGTPRPGGAGDVVVRGRPPRGAVASDIPAERSLNAVDVRSLGASTVEELLQVLGPQLSSGRGRSDDGPVVLLNGKRVSSVAEIARLPTEAIERTDVFPEEVALAYGYRADQKVVNVVTFPRFASRIAQLSYARPTEGGRDTPGASADYLRIRGDGRISVGADYSRSGALLESERGIAQVPGAAADAGRFRTLLPSTERGTITATLSGSVLAGVASTVNARFEAAGATSLFGPGPGGPLASDARSRILHAGTTQAGRLGGWHWTATGNVDRTVTATRTNRADGGRDEARAATLGAGADLLLAGPVLALPAGRLTASVRTGATTRDFRSASLVAGLASGTALSRDGGSVEASVDAPITGTGPLGKLSVNGNARFEHLSGVGDLRTVGYGLRWSPLTVLDLRLSYTDEEGAPTVEQLGNPTVAIPGFPVFDVTTGQAVAVTRVVGGNPALRADDRRVFSAGLSARPLGRELSIAVDYVDTRIDRPIATFPLLTPAIEAAFPDRFERDAAGRLLRIDSRPLNFARSRQRQLRTVMSWSRPLGPVPASLRNADIRFAPNDAEVPRNLPPGAVVRHIDAGSPEARPYQNLSSRLFLAAQHLWRLEDTVTVREGGPLLDLLDGDAIDGRGGRPRHEVEVQAGVFKRGLGARLTVDWRAGTSARGLAPTTADPAGRLAFGSTTTAGLFLFADIGDHLGRARSPSWLRGARATLAVTNLLDARPTVRDVAGATPLTYQPAYLDPLGRLISVSFRKVFT